MPSNLWEVETRTLDQLHRELDDIEDPFVFQVQGRDQLLANNKITIELVNDDIIYDEVGAIVNPANAQLDHNYGLSDQIASIGGTEVENESKEWVDNCGEVPIGNCAITRSGKLECQYVIHTVAPDFTHYQDEDDANEMLQNAVINSLEAAKSLNLDSVSMTALSSGRLGYPSETCAHQMIMAAIKYSAL